MFVYKRNRKTKEWVGFAGPIAASNIDEAGVSANFGTQVALSRSGHMLFVGSPDADVESINSVGTVYIFKYNKKTRTYEQTQLIALADSTETSHFGWDVVVSNNNKILVVGSCEWNGVDSISCVWMCNS